MRYSKEIYDKAEKKLYDIRQKAQEDLEFRRSVLYKRCPRASQIEKQLASTAIRAAKTVLRGGDITRELSSLKDNNLKLQDELKEILNQYGFQEDYLEVKRKCDKCRDEGFIDGKMCDCMEKILRQEAYNELNKLSPLSLSTFDTFSLDYYSDIPDHEGGKSPRDIMSAIYRVCLDYANNFSSASRNIVMRGGAGLGKTHLSLAIANTVIKKGFGVIYISTPNMVSRLEKERFKDNSSESSSEEYFINCDLLIIDDLGTEFSTQFSNSAIYNIINSRIMMAKPTIINTNLSIKELEKNYTERMSSRIKGSAVVLEFTGSDIRQQKMMKKFSRR